MSLEEKSQTIDHVEQNEKEWSHTQGKEGADMDRNMSLWEAIKAYPGAIAWSFLLSSSIIMEGYDIVLIGNLMAQPAFQKAYGDWYGDKLGYQISGPWQSGLGNATAVGTIIGAFANGWLTQRYGYRRTLVASLIAVTGFIFITFFAHNLPMLLAGSLLCGLPWGVFATMAPAYASEICPMALRGYLANYVCLCWALGQLLAAGVLFSFSGGTTQWSYRIPFAIQWIWPIPLIIILWFTPESPYWLAKQNRLDEAKKVLRRISAKSSKTDEDLDKQLAMIVHTNKIESEHSQGSSYLDCFKGINLRRTEIVSSCLSRRTQLESVSAERQHTSLSKQALIHATHSSSQQVLLVSPQLGSSSPGSLSTVSADEHSMSGPVQLAHSSCFSSVFLPVSLKLRPLALVKLVLSSSGRLSSTLQSDLCVMPSLAKFRLLVSAARVSVSLELRITSLKS
jgi:sugar porter (SP) family MFS transporter